MEQTRAVLQKPPDSVTLAKGKILGCIGRHRHAAQPAGIIRTIHLPLPDGQQGGNGKS